MSKKPNYFRQTVKLLEELHKSHPSFSMGRHLSSALSDYGDCWGMSDKELAFALEKYQAQLDAYEPESEIERIIADTNRLFDPKDPLLFDEEEDEDSGYLEF